MARGTLITLIAYCSTLCLAPAATAEPVTVSELVSGDLPQDTRLAPTFTFDFGANTISGSTSGSPQFADFDSFKFTIPAGAQLSAIELKFATSSSPNVLGFNHQANFVTGTASFHDSFDLLGTGTMQAFAAWLPQPAGLYTLQATAFAVSFNTGGWNWAMNYSWKFDVEPVESNPAPEPSTFLLLGSGAFVVAFRGLRAKFPRNPWAR